MRPFIFGTVDYQHFWPSTLTHFLIQKASQNISRCQALSGIPTGHPVIINCHPVVLPPLLQFLQKLHLKLIHIFIPWRGAIFIILRNVLTNQRKVYDPEWKQTIIFGYLMIFRPKVYDYFTVSKWSFSVCIRSKIVAAILWTSDYRILLDFAEIENVTLQRSFTSLRSFITGPYDRLLFVSMKDRHLWGSYTFI